MFTGLVEAVGRVVDVQTTPSGRRLTIDSALLADVREGDSVCVNGVCLTATHVGGGQMAADIGPETMRVTTLGRIDAGARVNLERAMRQDGRLGGHFVTGHVDGTGRVVAMRADGESHWVSVAFDAAFARLQGRMTHYMPSAAEQAQWVKLFADTRAKLRGTVFNAQVFDDAVKYAQ